MRKAVFDAVEHLQRVAIKRRWLLYSKLLQHGELIFMRGHETNSAFTLKLNEAERSVHKAFDELPEMYDIFESKDYAPLETINAARSGYVVGSQRFSMARTSEVWR